MTEESTGKNSSSKGRPTRSRKDAVAARKTNALAPAVTKEQKKAQRELAKQARATQRVAYMRGDESALPARDRGPHRRWVRNYIDSKWSIGELFMPIVFAVLIFTMIPNRYIQLMAILAMYLIMLYTFISGFFLTRKIKKEVEIRFPNESTRGIGMYGFLRSTQMRRMRAPAPQVNRGDSF